jgi:hypothetical protein
MQGHIQSRQHIPFCDEWPAREIGSQMEGDEWARKTADVVLKQKPERANDPEFGIFCVVATTFQSCDER